MKNRHICRFRVGDLVMLSTAGEARNHNSHAVGGWGIIKEINPKYNCDFPIATQWYDGDEYSRRRSGICFKPYELKFFKKSS